jgi:glycosyltransferase involved in cell wall biosynthesis
MKILVLLVSPIDNDSRVKNLISTLSNDKSNLIFLQYLKNDPKQSDYNFMKSNVTVKSYTSSKNLIYSFFLLFFPNFFKSKKIIKKNKVINTNPSYIKFRFIYVPITNLFTQMHLLLRGLLLLDPGIQTWIFKKDALKFNPDIVHANDLSTLGLGVKIKKKHRSKLIYDSHELETDRNLKLSFVQKLTRNYVEKKCIKYADRVITVSESIANHLSKLYSIKKPLVIYNAPNLKHLKINSSFKESIFREHIKDISNVNIILYIGLISFNRGLENLVSSFDKFLQEPINKKTNHLFIIGPMSEAFRSSNLDLFDLCRNNNNIHILPPVPQIDIPNVLKNANISVIPIQNCCKSYDFCLPNKLFESVFSYLPIAASNLFELSMFIKKYKCGEIFDPADPEDIAKKITKILLSDKKIYINDRKIEEIKKLYSLEIQNQNLIDLYSRI